MTPEVLSEVNVAAFWRSVRKSDGCWEWAGSRDKDGYGSFKVMRGGRWIHFRANRLAYALTHGECPDDKDVCHTCDNPPCVRPDHLFLGTEKENLADSIRKGRFPRGETHHNAKLTDVQVREIVQRHAAGESYLRLGPEYGIHPMTVYKYLDASRRRTALVAVGG